MADRSACAAAPSVRRPRRGCAPRRLPPAITKRRSTLALDLLKEKGTPLDRQVFNWQELAPPPYSKLNDDAFTRVRVILMNGIESDAIRFGHAAAKVNPELQLMLAKVRRVEQHQQTAV